MMKNLILFLVLGSLAFGADPRPLVVIPTPPDNEHTNYTAHTFLTIRAIQNVRPEFDERAVLKPATTNPDTLEKICLGDSIPLIFNLNYWGRDNVIQTMKRDNFYWFVGLRNEPDSKFSLLTKGVSGFLPNVIVSGGVTKDGIRRSSSSEILEFLFSFYFNGRDECLASYAAGVAFGTFLNYCDDLHINPRKITGEQYNFIRWAMRYSAGLEWTPEYGFGTPASHYDDGSTPVVLASISAELTPSGVVVSWTTASEDICYGFAVERKINDGPWEEIWFMTGSGSTQQENHYSFLDYKVERCGAYQYRLRQIDTDGSYVYLPQIASVEVDIVSLVEVQENNQAKKLLGQNFPNPVKTSTTIPFSLEKGSCVTLKVYNVRSQEVGVVVDQFLLAGQHCAQFSAGGLVSGIYIYIIQAGELRASKRMVVVR